MIKVICNSKSHHTYRGTPPEAQSSSYQATFIVQSDGMKIESPRFDVYLSEAEYERLVVGHTYSFDSLQRIPPVTFNGSVTDLATDVAFELKPEQARVLIKELEQFLSKQPGKFKA